MEVNLLDKMLATFHQQGIPVTFVLQNKVRVTGIIRAFDNYVIVLQNQKGDILYRHAVSSLLTADAATHAKPAKQQEARKGVETHGKRPASLPNRQKGHRAASRMPEASESSINTSMKEGLLRWMQGNKANK